MADQDNDIRIKAHAVLMSSDVNGPGRRAVIFFQGCPFDCDGCFNPETHSESDGYMVSPKEILDGLRTDEIEGITVSGGDPFMQPGPLTELLRLARDEYGLSTVVYTGYTIELLRKKAELARPLEYIDVLIDGGFVSHLMEPTLLARGSTNQRFHFLTDYYEIGDFYMPSKAEIVIRPDGTITGTGFRETLGHH